MHVITERGFPVNIIVQNLVKRHEKKLSSHMGDMEFLDKAQGFLADCEKLAREPARFTFEYFSDLKNRVVHVREELIDKIDECSEMLIAQIEAAERDCEANIGRMSSHLPDETLNQLRETLDDWQERANFSLEDELVWKEMSAELLNILYKVEMSNFGNKNALFSSAHRRNELEAKYSDVPHCFAKHVGFKQ
jgi:hypothetical protein